MKRSGFKTQRRPGDRAAKIAKQISAAYTLRPREVAVAAAPLAMAAPVPKEGALQHLAYMAIMRTLPCVRCGVVGLTQFCHADEGKGLAIKSDCRLGWPGCGPNGNDPGCHWLVGTSGRLGKEGRRVFEAAAGRLTRDAVRAAGRWPASLPEWAPDFTEILETT